MEKEIYSAVLIKNSGKHVKDWVLYHNLSAKTLKERYQKCNGRIVDLSRLDNGNYNAIVVKKRGVDNVSWWWKLNKSYEEINQFNSDNGTRIVDLHSRGNGKYDFVLEKRSDVRWKYRLGIFSDLTHLAGQEKLRITGIEGRISNGKRVYDAIMVRHTNSLEEKLLPLTEISLLEIQTLIMVFI